MQPVTEQFKYLTLKLYEQANYRKAVQVIFNYMTFLLGLMNIRGLNKEICTQTHTPTDGTGLNMKLKDQRKICILPSYLD
jgi:hypothetical protein